jgi:hypothetical protein
MARKTARASKRATKGKPTSKKTARKSSRPKVRRHKPTPGLYGWITHTELASADPLGTKDWCARVLGWTFTQSIPMPGGEYHLFAYSEKGGGGIRAVAPGEAPGSNFTVHVADARESFEKALSAGAEPVTPPTRIMEGVTIAVVRAPGGVRVGFSGP